MSIWELNRELAAALGVTHARKATLVLEAGCIPTLTIEEFPELKQRDANKIDAGRLARAPFILRLQPVAQENP